MTSGQIVSKVDTQKLLNAPPQGLNRRQLALDLIGQQQLLDPSSLQTAKRESTSGAVEVAIPEDFGIEVRFERVDMVYVTRPEVAVLDGVELTLKEGTTTALVGESGSGKRVRGRERRVTVRQ